MGLAETQRALARLYTDAALRDQFFENPALAGASLGLEDEEALALASAERSQFEFFADSLHRKRLGEVRRLLPLTRKALGTRFGEIFIEYSETYVPSGLKKYEVDAQSFAEFLDQRSIEYSEDWIPSLARYEAAWLEAWSTTDRWMVRHFEYPVGHLSVLVRNGKTIPSFKRGCYSAIWFRMREGKNPFHLIVKNPFKSFLKIGLQSEAQRHV